MKVRVKRKISHAFTRATGYQISRAANPAEAVPPPPMVSAQAMQTAREGSGERLLVRPTFILSSVRSGSTLIRAMLNAHSQIFSPHEVHLRELQVHIPYKYAVQAVWELGLDRRGLQHLLWDRLLHRELMRSGKSVLVNKTPSDAFIWRDILDCWPDAQFIFLLRHPLSITDSWNKARKHWTREQAAADINGYLTEVQAARTEQGGLTVRYEDVTTDPERETRRICEFLGVEWESSMVNYGEAGPSFVTGLGDWSSNIKSGKVQPARPLPSDEEIPEVLLDISKQWGYLRESYSVPSGS